MIKFDCDYLEGACPEIMKALNDTNFMQTDGYGFDEYCDKARALIKKECKTEDAEVYFLVGGTQTNTTVIASSLRPYQGVMCASTGHINVHESGAIEGTGHKVIPLCSSDGKVYPGDVNEYCENYWNDHTHEHMVQPAMLYISQPTENGTLYTKAELAGLKKVCENYSMYLYVDGARLGYGIEAEGNDVYIDTLAELSDVFYIGGTKVGALFGEAVVIINDEIKRDFRYMIKRHGGLFAKGRLLGIQFLTLFEDGLYYRITSHADNMAYKLRDIFISEGYGFLCESRTNQQFPILPDAVLEKLSADFSCDYWVRTDDSHSAVRFCASWATREENVDDFARALHKITAELK